MRYVQTGSTIVLFDENGQWQTAWGLCWGNYVRIDREDGA